MKYINLFYIAILMIAVSLFLLQKKHKSNIISFYGYAENKETEINFNHPVQVKKIHVLPGQQIKKDTPILDVIRKENDIKFIDQDYKKEGILAEKKIWINKIEGQIKLIKEEKSIELSAITNRKNNLISDREFTNELYEGLKSVTKPSQNNTTIADELQTLEEEYQRVSKLYDQKIKNKEEELSIGNRPYDSEIERLSQEKLHDETQSSIEISMIAPKDGLIGNIYCKEEEHFTSYKTLLSFYEPNPSIIKGFIQEDFIMQINLEDKIVVKSTKDENIKYNGKVIGLGSRIVEIPPRLRKREDIKTFGREIIVSIPEQNQFLQKEKTILELVSSMPIEDDSATNTISVPK